MHAASALFVLLASHLVVGNNENWALERATGPNAARLQMASIVLSDFAHVLLTTCPSGQYHQVTTVSDGFESYAVSNLLGTVNTALWNTYSATYTSSWDAAVSNTLAKTGTKSAELTSAVDNVLYLIPSGSGTNSYTTGYFDVSMALYIPTGQPLTLTFYDSKDFTSTGSWKAPISVDFSAGGSCTITQGGTGTTTTPFPYTQGAWFTFQVVADLDLNQWRIYVDGVSKAGPLTIQSSPANYNALATVEFCCATGSGTYMDDVLVAYTDPACIATSPSASPSRTASPSQTPSGTPTSSVTPSGTPTSSVTPSVTPSPASLSVTPSVSASASPVSASPAAVSDAVTSTDKLSPADKVNVGVGVGVGVGVPFLIALILITYLCCRKTPGSRKKARSLDTGSDACSTKASSSDEEEGSNASTAASTNASTNASNNEGTGVASSS